MIEGQLYDKQFGGHTHSKISIAKMPRLKKRGKKMQDPTFWHFPAFFLQRAVSKIAF